MKYINILRKMTGLNVDKLMEEISQFFKIFNLSKDEELKLFNLAAKFLLKKEKIDYKLAYKVFGRFYVNYLKKKIEEETLDLQEILIENTISDNPIYKEIIAVYEKKKQKDTKLTFDLPFAKLPSKCSLETIDLLKECSPIQFKYVFQKLSEKEKDMLYKKYGQNLDENNELTVGENEYLINVVLFKINNMINRFAGYYYFDQIFVDKNNKFEINSSYYNLDNKYKRILINCYGPLLNKPLNNNISAALEHKLKNLVIPRLRNYKNVASNNRKLASFEKIFSSEEQYTLSMLPQGYIDIINIAVDNNEKVFSACSNSVETKILIRNIDALLELILSSEEFSILCYHFGLKDYKKLTFKEIGEKIGLPKNRVSNIYVNIIDKLILSPDIKNLFNFLNKPITEDISLIVKSINTPTPEKPNTLTSFYGYFTTEEIKKLRNGMTCMNADEILFINSLFYLGFSQEINLKNITKQDKDYLEYIIKKIKNHIATNNNISETISSENVYKICSRLYIEPVYNEICRNLSLEEKEILDLCIRYEEFGEGTVKYVATIVNKSVEEVKEILKISLQKVYNNLARKSKENVLIRQLLLTEK